MVIGCGFHRYVLYGLLLLAMLFQAGVTFAETRAIEPYVKQFFPDMEKLGEFDGDPPAAVVLGKRGIMGYVFLTDDILPIPGYSGKPISTLVGIDRKGTIVGVKIVHHEEPILAVGISEADLEAFVNQYKGTRITDRPKIGGRKRPGYVALDSISGATITVMVVNATITKSVRKVAESRGIIQPPKPKAEKKGVLKIRGMGPVEETIWYSVWQDRYVEIIILIVSLGFLGLILIFQDWLARHPTFLKRMRVIFLMFTIFGIGGYMLGQLSIINVFTFVSAAMHKFSWDIFLIDPVIFILWSFVVVTLLLWGRGVYCGWLCPFGALQEVINKFARRFNIIQLEFPSVVHERLLALKYIIFIALFGLSLQSLEMVLSFIEIEPFKTVVTMRFDREWPYVVYAAELLVITVFNRKFFCKYLCPLGAALAIPTRLRLFDWLRRRKECGRPCQTCAQECEVQAIRPTGEIIENECHYCLDCQVTYWNSHKCPPMVEKRKRIERRIALKKRARNKASDKASEASEVNA